MPLFMTKNPTAEQVAASPDLQAMQTLVDLDTTPECEAHDSPMAAALCCCYHCGVCSLSGCARALPYAEACIPPG